MVLVATSPRFPGLMAAQIWTALRAAEVVLVAEASHPGLPSLDAAGIPWRVLEGPGVEDERPKIAEAKRPGIEDDRPEGPGIDVRVACLLEQARRSGSATYLLAPEGDEAFVRSALTAAARDGAECEVVSFEEPQGAAVLDLVSIMAKLRAPDGCPWDRKQTHESLARYLVEETYEVLQAIEDGSATDLEEELGDVLLQVVFHAQMAADAGNFDIDAVARHISAKLIHRHPHVFGNAEASTAEQVVHNWELIKAAEKGRTDPFEGVPSGLPALQLAAKLQKKAAAWGFDWASIAGIECADAICAQARGAKRSERDQAGTALSEEVGEAEGIEQGDVETAAARGAQEFGDELFVLVARARRAGVDAEAALREAGRRFRLRLQAAVETAAAEGRPPESLTREDWQRLWEAVGLAETRAGAAEDGLREAGEDRSRAEDGHVRDELGTDTARGPDHGHGARLEADDREGGT